jgi:hypothetical protein
VCSQSVRERDWTISLLKEVVHGQHKGDNLCNSCSSRWCRDKAMLRNGVHGKSARGLLACRSAEITFRNSCVLTNTSGLVL